MIDKFEEKHFKLRPEYRNAGFEKENGISPGEHADEDAKDKDDDDEEEEDEEFDDMKEKDNILLAKLDTIDRKLEEKLADLEYTFGRKGKLLEEKIRDLTKERN
ncbi:hypothetical protein PIB30_046612 [Stylosanthes scabra]|uniref:Uncharacterized protein n=1 Tax=Stylosanthes scabra TaxID=79078 RepID=A0ABU6TIE2_9FABA|nr:hypothetical protein [Stylosanthes scabra]